MSDGVALVGLGYWGSKLLRNLAALVGDRLVAVDADAAKRASALRSVPGVRLASSLDEALADPSVGAVVVATPVSSHFPLARQALLAGRHVMVEKPLAGSYDQAVELAQIADECDRTLMAGHTFLFSPRVERVKRHLDDGAMGAVHYVTSERLNLGVHRSDANVIWDLAAHDFSLLFHLLGEFPQRIHTMAHGVIRRGLPEVAFMNLLFPSGVIGSVTVAWLAPRKVRNTVIVGERNMIVYDDTQPEEPVKIYDRGVERPEADTFGQHQLTYRFGDTRAVYVSPEEPLARELAHFLECARRGDPCLSDGWFGAGVVRALEAAERSWQQGGMPVSLDDIGLSATA